MSELILPVNFIALYHHTRAITGASGMREVTAHPGVQNPSGDTVHLIAQEMYDLRTLGLARTPIDEQAVHTDYARLEKNGAVGVGHFVTSVAGISKTLHLYEDGRYTETGYDPLKNTRKYQYEDPRVASAQGDVLMRRIILFCLLLGPADDPHNV